MADTKMNDSKDLLESSGKNGNGYWAKAIVVVAIAGMSSISTVLVNRAVIDPRPDPITATQVEVIRLQMVSDFENKLRNVENQCEANTRDMLLRRPPEKTRERIRQIEKWIERTDSNFSPPSDAWGD